jgi:hypothetical protein
MCDYKLSLSVFLSKLYILDIYIVESSSNLLILSNY